MEAGFTILTPAQDLMTRDEFLKLSYEIRKPRRLFPYLDQEIDREDAR